jgi:AraC-like DNA-binding protein
VTYDANKLTPCASRLLTESLLSKVRTIQAKAAEKITRAAASQGVPAGTLYRAVGMDPEVLNDPDARIPFAQIVALYEQAATLTGDDAFGLHVGEHADPTAFDVLGYSVINSPTFGDALDRVVRYNSIWTNGSCFSVETVNGQTRFVYLYLDEAIRERRQDAEMTFAALVVLGRRVTHVDWSPSEIRFQHERPRETTEHERIFQCPVFFAATTNEVVFDSVYSSLPIVKADPSLCALLDRHANELLSRYPREDSLVERIRTLMKDELKGGDASLEVVAEKLGMSARTLQRKLHTSGTSHQELLDEMRRDLAVRYLREPGMAVCEVAYLLGFSESSAFHRAFKRWTGKTPSEFRRRRSQYPER